VNIKNADRRVRRTKKLLLQGLKKLMSEKKINKITVTELTKLVDVNRAAFYLYYKDIFDMAEKNKTEMFLYFSEALEKYSPGIAPPKCSKKKAFYRKSSGCFLVMFRRRPVFTVRRFQSRSPQTRLLFF
jgi:hypothetical protein